MAKGDERVSDGGAALGRLSGEGRAVGVAAVAAAEFAVVQQLHVVERRLLDGLLVENAQLVLVGAHRVQVAEGGEDAEQILLHVLEGREQAPPVGVAVVSAFGKQLLQVGAVVAERLLQLASDGVRSGASSAKGGRR